MIALCWVTLAKHNPKQTVEILAGTGQALLDDIGLAQMVANSHQFEPRQRSEAINA